MIIVINIEEDSKTKSASGSLELLDGNKIVVKQLYDEITVSDFSFDLEERKDDTSYLKEALLNAESKIQTNLRDLVLSLLRRDLVIQTLGGL